MDEKYRHKNTVAIASSKIHKNIVRDDKKAIREKKAEICEQRSWKWPWINLWHDANLRELWESNRLREPPLHNSIEWHFAAIIPIYVFHLSIEII